jgi:ribulose-phosphate 3-epimerase
MSNIIIAPSLLAADFCNLEREFEKINRSSAEWIHFDVMDGLFVPNISFGFPLLEATRKLTDKFIDCHLMIENPARYFEEFKRGGADGLTIHFEGNLNLKNDLICIRELGMKSGLVINPNTSLDEVKPYIEDIDLLLIMSIEPGFGGQKFMESTYDKLAAARALIAESKRDIKLQIDGGVSIENSKRIIDAGADVLVSGSALFKADNFIDYVDRLKN